MNNIDRQYKELVEHILHFGVEKKDRTGTGTKSIFGWQLRHNMKDGFPLLTTKRMAWKSICTELIWFLRGETNIKFLVDNKCYIWNGDAIKNYEKHNGEIDWGPFITKEEAFIEAMKNSEFAKMWGELGPLYGKQWRSWEGLDKTKSNWEDFSIEIDQIQNLINELKTNPDSRRLMVSAWNVGELNSMVLQPCHYGFQLYTRELSLEERAKWLQDTKGYDLLVGNLDHDHIREVVENESPTRAISLMFNMRSNDVPLGLPFNLASYGLLLEILAKHVNMVTDELITNIGDAHIYLNQIEGVREQINRTPYELPTVKISDRIVNDISEYEIDDFVLENYKSHPSIKIPLSN